jgi:hypothetical protein
MTSKTTDRSAAVLIMTGEASANPIAPRNDKGGNDNLKRAATPAVIMRTAARGDLLANSGFHAVIRRYRLTR